MQIIYDLGIFMSSPIVDGTNGAFFTALITLGTATVGLTICCLALCAARSCLQRVIPTTLACMDRRAERSSNAAQTVYRALQGTPTDHTAVVIPTRN